MLLAHVAHEARLSERQKDGSTARDHVETFVRSGRFTTEQLDGPEPPEELRYLLGWFDELSAARSAGPHGLNPVSYLDVYAWAELTDRRPEPHEVRAILRLDQQARRPSACRCEVCALAGGDEDDG